MALFTYPNSAVFWYDFRFQGQRFRASTRTRDRRLAERVEREKRRELEEGANGLRKIQKPKQVCQLFSEHVEKKKSAWTEKTLDTAHTSWARLRSTFAYKFAGQIDAAEIGRWVDLRVKAGISPYSINRDMSLLRALLKRAGVWQNIREDYKPLPTDDQSGTALTVEQEEKLLEAGRKSLSLCFQAALVVALSTGMRNTELRLLRWRNVDLDGGYLIVAKSKTLCGRGRRLLLPARALAALRLWAERFPQRQPDHYVFCSERYGRKNHKLKVALAYGANPERPMGSFETAWRSTKKRADLKLRFHDLRHTVVTRLLAGGTPFHTVAAMMGWSAGNMVLMIKKYGHLCDSSMRDAVKLLNGK